ncbi:hypothetical protein LTR10_011550 [Elasticomyces elasticus]|uniref:FAD dependent oxidoreductase domain-containing protein n=1 Tax=Exophiala sideris TaxID=1016849 RepID=A0ABR0JDK0_9EURO|nr:hypothetical protein LTR10_011550 [Elasticomyces elasticus]KAK5031992.1 hypothetical protein LTS07_004614 [Exophiala sideris]KAK5040921.1 hypothetical protein LTR13_003223 [Exophiala sideris]KAK5061745.1 hypothetical protein LTR69_004927 [Exophiala sideris]KAK5184445.1 hypothetical protein LTR44_003118 [Eurotiomycetes sp. CCFEE 6388]
MLLQQENTLTAPFTNGVVAPRTSSEPYDVVVVGGGAAGVGAAIGAKQTAPQSRVLIVESEACLGGAATHRGVLSYCGLYSVEPEPRRAVGSIWTELHSRLVAEGLTFCQHVDPEGLKHVLDDLIASYGIEVLLHCTVVGGERRNGELTAIEVQERRGRRMIRGKAFVDCSGDGDLACHAGASTRYGNHGQVNMGSLATRFGGLINANPTSALWRDAIQAAKVADPALKKIIPRSVGVLIKLPASGDICTYMASAMYDARSSASISAAEKQGRMQAKVYLDILRKLPGHENMYLVSSGPNFGTRESRHINARYQLTEADIFGGQDFEDTVAVGAWYTEWHDGSKEDWPILFREPPEGTFEIPLRCLHSIDTPNLFCAGRCADGDQAASSAIRVMGTALATGQAAGTAAAVRASTDNDPDPQEVRRLLLKHGALLDRHNLVKAVHVEEPEGMNLSHNEALRGH